MAKKKINKTFNPLVSIIIPVYNGANYVGEAIDSALAQTYKNIEIIVVNDGSTDNSEEIIKSYGNKLRYFKKENGGVSTALNLGIKKSKGEYISWLSHDDLYYPNKIERQVEEFRLMDEKQRGNSIVFCHFDALVASTGKIISGFEKILPWSDYNFGYRFSMLDCFFSSKLNGCTLLFPKRVFYNFGFFDDTKRTIQDYLLFINFFKNGVRYIYIDEILITSRHHENQDTHKRIDLHISELNFLYKYTFDLFKDEFSLMPMWQFDHFLKIIKKRGLDKVYAYMLTGWSNKECGKNKPNIWLYWENKIGSRTPDYIRLCWKSIINFNSYDFNIKILTEDDIETFLPKINKEYLNLSEIAHKADYIRFNLLYKYGGIWLDSDFVSFKSLAPVVEEIKKNSFVCMGYKQSDKKYFPLIGFLGSLPKNIICKKMIEDMNRIIRSRSQPKWDELGGYSLAKYINDNTYNDKYIYDSSYFLPYPIHINIDNNVFFRSSMDINSIINKNNPLAYGQNIANSVLAGDIKLMDESEILLKDNFLGSVLRLGLGFDLILNKENNLNEILSQVNNFIKKIITSYVIRIKRIIK